MKKDLIILAYFLLFSLIGKSQIITTIAGTYPGYYGDGGLATVAGLFAPTSVAYDRAGNVYIADNGNNVIRKVNTLGIISTFAGIQYTTATGLYGGDGGAATSAYLASPTGVAVDTAGNVYIADVGNARIRKVNGLGIITTIAGNGTYGYSGDGTLATSAELNYPWGVAVDRVGNVYIADGGNARIRKINTAGIISTFAGNGTYGYSGDGGSATSAKLSGPWSVAVDGAGNVYIAEAGNTFTATGSRIRKINTSGIISTIAGNGTYGYSGDGGMATLAMLNDPRGISVDIAGNVYVGDFGNNVIRKVNTSGIITTFAGGGASILPFHGDGGPADSAYLYNPWGVNIDSAGNVFIADYNNSLIRKVSGISGSATLCFGSTTTLSDAITGGKWSSGNTTIATVGSTTGIVTGVTQGATTITYTIGSSIAIATITVNPLPFAGIINGLSNVCDSATIIVTDTTVGGTWSAIYSNATVDSSGIVTGATAGVDSIKYTVINSCGTATAAKALTVNPLPAAGPIAGIATVCVLSTTSLSDGTPGGIWSSVTPSVATVGSTGLVTGISSGNDTIKYTVTNSCGIAVATKIVTVNPLPIAGAITGIAIVCVSSTTSLSNATTGGIWSSSTSSVATVGSTGLVTGISSGMDSIKYTITNSCGTAIATKIITVNPVPHAGTIAGGSIFCAGVVITLTDTASGGTWSSSSTSLATIGSSTGLLTGISSGIVTISYTISNSCGTANAIKIITINPLPNAGSISGLSMVCVSSSISLTDTATGGLWGASNGKAFVSSVGVVLGVSGGIDTIKYSVTNSCGTSSATKVVTINPAPSAGIITGLDTVCVSSSITLADTVAGGTWSASNGNAFVSSTGVVLGVTVGLDDITYTIINTCGTGTIEKNIQVITCSTGLSKIPTPTEEITIYPNPTQDNITVTSSTPINSIVISNLIGQNVYSGSFNTNSVAVSLQQVPGGVYVVKINGNKVYKIVKD